jgi:putative membrane protein
MNWLELKILLVLAMSGVHGFFVRCVREFGADQNQRSQKFYRAINELPTILMIGIVLLAVVKPF